MDASKPFACTIMHPKLFPGPITIQAIHLE